MNITKETVTYILGILEDEEIIDSYNFYKKENSIVVESIGDFSNKAHFKFDDNDKLINPQIAKIDKEILKLQKQINELEKQKNFLK